ncbi:pyridoxamine 5'-phosphate oxidase [Blochmannia endosymbiont of Camponotus sp.]|uniref:pyridoxamine 5'-phosphate oxidase n=1 Tax=Blochmannia endosymbiont of Camponotus sp. TaxID=700220 RepID=UPI002023BE5A|nr:pyridoxamine 5'-phosphate oxidase [Blochmannia endosymbiont of Camponotus sp.]URJ30289.1 pyridoxamine 5'-phosphate oxidase [Blochmannia endosymbiont of Camponotus sp.]
MSIDNTNISHIRREYTSGQLRHSDLTDQPIQLFSIWLNQAYFAQVPDPTAMCLATVDHTGQPYQRIVLLKEFTNKEMTFLTNLNSRKATHLANNPKISLCFPWNIIDRQVIVTGTVCKLSEKEVLKQFYTRPKNNQISTWVSNQSKIISSKNVLNNKFLELKKKYLDKKIPFPEFWGGYKININSMEFWQGGINRLHDRFIYQRCNHTWYVYRLSP